MAAEDSQRMTTEEVADLLGVSRKAVYMAVYRGHLRKARQGRGAAVFDRSDVEHYLARRHRPGQPDAYWIDTAEAAELLGVTPAWVRTLVHRGNLPGLRHASGRLLFRRQQIEVIARGRDSQPRG
jgi:excisionase family DNA binding protein